MQVQVHVVVFPRDRLLAVETKSTRIRFLTVVVTHPCTNSHICSLREAINKKVTKLDIVPPSPPVVTMSQLADFFVVVDGSLTSSAHLTTITHWYSIKVSDWTPTVTLIPSCHHYKASQSKQNYPKGKRIFALVQNRGNVQVQISM